MTSAAAYVRYSSHMQDDNFSLDAQLRQISLRASQDGATIVKVFSDPATSAFSKKFRPGIQELLRAAAKKEFDVVYVHKIDRLARRLEWAIEVVKDLQKADIQLKAVEQNFDINLPEGKLMFHLLGSLGEFYSDNLSLETGKGKYERVQQGYHNGQVAWGYLSAKFNNRSMAFPDELIAPVTLELFKRSVSGIYYDQDLADWLNDLGHRTNKNRPFTKDAIRTILQNPFYKGFVVYKGTYIPGKGYKKTEVFKGVHAAIIPEDLFDLCQKVRLQKRKSKNTNQITRKVYLLSGIISCFHCGKRMRAQSAKSGRYYREVSRYTGSKCEYNGKSIRSDEAETQIINLMKSISLPEDWQKSVEAILNEQKQVDSPAKRITQIKEEKRRLRELFRKGQYAEEEFIFWRNIEALDAELSSLEAITPIEIRNAANTMLGLAQAWQAATIEEQAELCKIVFKSVRFDFSRRKLHSLLPNPGYDVLFQMLPNLLREANGYYYFEGNE